MSVRMRDVVGDASLEEIVCWLNAWADEDRYKRHGRNFRLGYEQAVRDIMDELQPLAPDWIEEWREGGWRRLRGGSNQDTRIGPAEVGGEVAPAPDRRRPASAEERVGGADNTDTKDSS